MNGVSALLPREHGAWSILLLPFLSALVLNGRWDWTVLPVTVAMLGVFLAREPLLVLARQRWIWKEQRPESRGARRLLLGVGLALAGAGSWLARKWPAHWLVLFAAGAIALTALAVGMALRNRQRSVALQVLSAAGLTTSALAASLAASPALPHWAGTLWAVHTLHAVASVLTVHARLEARLAARNPSAGRDRRWRVAAWSAQGLLVAAGIGFGIQGLAGLMLALTVSAAVHAWELVRLPQPAVLAEPLRRVGFRALATSLGFTLLAITALW